MKITRLQDYKITRLQDYKIKIFLSLFVFSMFLTIGCNKETTPLENFSDDAVSYRSNDGIDVNWLTDFQTYLRDLRDNNTASASPSYTSEDARYGIETLFNIKYSRYQPDYETSYVIDSFTYESSTENYYDLFEKIESFIEAEYISNEKIAGVSIIIDREEGGISHFKTVLIFSGGNAAALQVYNPCEFFEKGESYYLGVLEYEDGISYDEPSLWLDCYNGGYGLCGGLDSNGNMTTTACTEIQRKLNEKKPKGIWCPEINGTAAQGYGHFNIHPIFFHLDGWSIVKEKENCYDSIEYDGLSPCDCVDWKQLNDIYFFLDSYIDSEAPMGYSFVSIDLGVDFVVRGDIEEARTSLYGDIFVGKPFCVRIDKIDLILDVNLDNVLD